MILLQESMNVIYNKSLAIIIKAILLALTEPVDLDSAFSHNRLQSSSVDRFKDTTSTPYYSPLPQGV